MSALSDLSARLRAAAARPPQVPVMPIRNRLSRRKDPRVTAFNVTQMRRVLEEQARAQIRGG